VIGIRRDGLRIGRAVGLVWRAAPGWTAAGAILVVAQGLLPLAGLLLVKKIVDGVAAGIGGGDPSAFWKVAPWIALAALASLAASVCRALGEYVGEGQSLAVTDAVSDTLHARSAEVDLAYYEDPRYQDTLHRSQKEALFRPTRVVNGLVQVCQGGIALGGIAGLFFFLNPLLAVLLMAVCVPWALGRFANARRTRDLERRKAEEERKSFYFHWLLTDPDHAKELRLFGLGKVFRERFGELRRGIREARLSLSRRRTVTDIATQGLVAAGTFGALALVARDAVAGKFTVGTLVMVLQGVYGGIGYAQSLLQGIVRLYEDNLFLADYYAFLDTPVRIAPPSSPVSIPARIRHGVKFEGVVFKYPRAERAALDGVDLEIRPGEVIALVGENGSGKTTLVKILARLYDPDAGRVACDGIDIRSFDPVLWRSRVAVLLQDYARYFLTARDNIRFGDVVSPPDEKRMVEAAIRSGADEVVRGLAHGYDTPLGHRFGRGQELSTGEWQRVALARVFYRDARIVVLDEPTSALDPIAEEELFRKFLPLVEGRGVVLVSHRASTVSIADRIYVMDKGKVVEHGTHGELLGRGGYYTRLNRAQAVRDSAGAAGYA